MGLDKSMMTCIHHYSIIHSIFYHPKNPLFSADSSLPTPIPANTDLFIYVSTALIFLECPVVGIIAFSGWLLSHRDMKFRFFHVFLWVDNSFLFSTE